MTTVVPLRYREVAFTAVDVPLSQDALAGLLMGREAYRRTRFIVAHGQAGVALVKVAKQSDEPLFSPIVAAELLAGPEETAFVTAPGTDVGVPSQLGRVAAQLAPGAKCVVVQGLYEHVSFILNPRPVQVRVVDVAPPYPAKLVDQASRMADIAEDLPPDGYPAGRDRPRGAGAAAPGRAVPVPVPGVRRGTAGCPGRLPRRAPAAPRLGAGGVRAVTRDPPARLRG